MSRTVCFLGYDHLGSWKIRGEQIAGQRPTWHAATQLGEDLLRRYDIFCVVKHFKPDWRTALKQSGKTVVFDVVDGWKQPQDNLRVGDRNDAVRLFKEKWKKLHFVDAHIFPTQAMQEDLQVLCPCATTIYHHFRPGMAINPIREIVRTIGYEGAPEYLSDWRGVLERFCAAHGLSFVINPDVLASIDIGIAARGAKHDSYLTRRYKSNVKLANFYGSGTPCVVQEGQSGYLETNCEFVEFFVDEDSLIEKLESLMQGRAKRQAIQGQFLQAAAKFDIRVIAEQYEAFFETVAQQSGARRRRFWLGWSKRLLSSRRAHSAV